MDESPELQELHCRHCGEPARAPMAPGTDFQCSACERYQDAMTCPTCGSVVRISLLPDNLAPAEHAPARPQGKD